MRALARSTSGGSKATVAAQQDDRHGAGAKECECRDHEFVEGHDEDIARQGVAR